MKGEIEIEREREREKERKRKKEEEKEKAKGRRIIQHTMLSLVNPNNFLLIYYRVVFCSVASFSCSAFLSVYLLPKILELFTSLTLGWLKGLTTRQNIEQSEWEEGKRKEKR